tara:strand:- start:17754 stop:17858 length:105 start_codon:yes stop_codon:yes gene_type:complete
MLNIIIDGVSVAADGVILLAFGAVAWDMLKDKLS